MRWSVDGKAAPPKGLNVRQVVERRLRPLSVGLRVPRKEQEYCRQTLSTLIRMVLVPAFMHIAGRWNWWPGVRHPPPETDNEPASA